MITKTETARRGGWMCTFTGRQFWPLDPRPEDIAIEDIARGLSNCCRFAGHVNEFYSVAQHSVHVSAHVRDLASEDDFLARAHALAGLLHDAAEAYVGDVVRPLKRELKEYRTAEHRILRAVSERWGKIICPVPTTVDQVDRRMLLTEARDLCDMPAWVRERAEEWGLDPYPGRVQPWDSRTAERIFLELFSGLEDELMFGGGADPEVHRG